MPLMTPQLLDSEKLPVISRDLTLGKQGITLSLQMGAQQRLKYASLRLQGSADELNLSAATLTTDKGPVASNFPAAAIKWVSAEWDELQVITAIHLQGASGKKCRIKIDVSGNWVPLTPSDVVDANGLQRLPRVVTQKIMIELLETTDIESLYKTSSAVVSGLIIKASKQPVSVQMQIANQTPFYKDEGGLSHQHPPLMEGFTSAVNAYIEQQGTREIKVPITLTAQGSGKLQISEFFVEAESVITQLENLSDSGLLTIPWQQQATAEVILDVNTEVREVCFLAKTTLQAQRLLWNDPLQQSAQALHCTPDYRVAQGFNALSDDDQLIGIDFYLNKAINSESSVSGVLSLHPDDNGMPAEQPYAGIEIPFEISAEKLQVSAWLSIELPAPLLLNQGQWWAVLNVSQGELFCSLSEQSLSAEYISETSYRISGGSWLALPPADTRRLQSRLRVVDHQPKRSHIQLQRGAVTIDVNSTTDGEIVRLDAEQLAPLNQSEALQSTTLQLVVQGEAAGEITFSQIKIVSGQKPS